MQAGAATVELLHPEMLCPHAPLDRHATQNRSGRHLRLLRTSALLLSLQRSMSSPRPPRRCAVYPRLSSREMEIGVKQVCGYIGIDLDASQVMAA